MRRVHYSGAGFNTVCGLDLGFGFSYLHTSRRRSVTCQRCRKWMRLVCPRPRRLLPNAQRVVHFYGPGLEVISARCGVGNHAGMITGKMGNVTCGRCKRLLGVRPWRVRKMQVRHYIDLNYLRRTGQLGEKR